jgi:alpha-D-ribose 1-methylphosphonate 5-triphosphate synthase subunit PhnG
MVRRDSVPSMPPAAPSEAPAEAEVRRRQRWLSLLAKAPIGRLEELWSALGPTPAYSTLRQPEIGLVMVQGRISGSGAAFCAGEMTVSRAAVRLQTGEIGFGYVGGRALRQAEIAAAIDALGQRAEWRDVLEARILAPLAAEAEARRRLVAARAAATKVDFFTVAREAGT